MTLLGTQFLPSPVEDESRQRGYQSWVAKRGQEYLSSGYPGQEGGSNWMVESRRRKLTWKWLSYSLTDEWIKMWCIYMMEDSSAIKKNDMSFVAIWMDLEMIILSEVRQRQIPYNITNMWNLKNWYKWTYLQNRNRLIDLKNKLMVAKAERCRGCDKLGVRD